MRYTGSPMKSDTNPFKGCGCGTMILGGMITVLALIAVALLLRP